MSFAVYSSYSKPCRYFPGEVNGDDWALGPIQIYTDYASIPKLIHCPPHLSVGSSTQRDFTTAAWVTEVSRHFCSLVPSLGGSKLWGGPYATQFMDAAWSYITGGSNEKVFLTGHSHGGIMALNWAKLRPDKVLGIALVQPALGLADLKLVYDGLLAPEIEDAFTTSGSTPGYTDAEDGPTWSPNIYGDDLDPDIPVCIWTSDAGYDTVCRTGPEEQFLEKRPTTMRKSLGPIDHGLPAIDLSRTEVVNFARSCR